MKLALDFANEGTREVLAQIQDLTADLDTTEKLFVLATALVDGIADTLLSVGKMDGIIENLAKFDSAMKTCAALSHSLPKLFYADNPIKFWLNMVEVYKSYP